MNQLLRIFFIINNLIETQLSVQELQNLLWDKFQASPNNIYKDFNLIKKLGFNIREMTNNQLIIDTLPFTFKLFEEDKELINDIFKTYANNSGQLSNFFERLGQFLNFDLSNLVTPDEFIIDESNPDYQKTKKKLQEGRLLKKKVIFKYQAIDKDIREHGGFVFKIERDEKKIERVIILHDYTNRYGEYNLDRIISVPEIRNEQLSGDFPSFFCRFKLYPPTAKAYHRLPGETESFDDEDGTKIITCRYFTPFRLIQKILKYGENAKILDPPDAIAEMKRRILKMNDLYNLSEKK